MSADRPLTGDELATIKARAEGRSVWEVGHLRPDVLRMVAEIERHNEAERISRDREAYLVVIDTMHALKSRAETAEAEVERLREELEAAEWARHT